MGLLSRKIEPKVEDLPQREEMSQEELSILKEALLSRDEVKIFLAYKAGEKLFNIASKL